MPLLAQRHSTILRLALGAALGLFAPLAQAQTDEIQVYDAAIAEPGQVTLTVHSNYIAAGQSQPDFAGGLVPNHLLSGVTEWGLGLFEWWELGAYVPFVLSLDAQGRVWIDGAKLRTLFVSPHAEKRQFFYGINFELGFSRPQWSPVAWQLEARPILGVHLGAWTLVLNPIVDIPFALPVRFDFAPATRLLYAGSQGWGVGLELYEEFGPLGSFVSLPDQQQELFGVIDWNGERFDLELGLGVGLTRRGSDALIVKLILTPHLSALLSEAHGVSGTE